jgi:hypothetical protein
MGGEQTDDCTYYTGSCIRPVAELSGTEAPTKSPARYDPNLPEMRAFGVWAAARQEVSLWMTEVGEGCDWAVTGLYVVQIDYWLWISGTFDWVTITFLLWQAACLQ